MRLGVTCAVLLFLAACSGQPQVVNPNKPPAEARADYDECNGMAAVAVALVPKGKDVEAMRQKSLDDCMRSRGYKVDAR